MDTRDKAEAVLQAMCIRRAIFCGVCETMTVAILLSDHFYPPPNVTRCTMCNVYRVVSQNFTARYHITLPSDPTLYFKVGYKSAEIRHNPSLLAQLRTSISDNVE